MSEINVGGICVVRYLDERGFVCYYTVLLPIKTVSISGTNIKIIDSAVQLI